MTGMSPPTSPSSSKRLARGPFAAAVIVVYALSFASQVLLSPAVTGRLGVVPFVAAQGALIALWVILHQRRLRDAGRGAGTSIGIALVYALEVVLLTILVWLVLSTSGSSHEGAGSEAPILQLFVLLYFMTLLTGDSGLGELQYWMMGLAVLMILPVVIALCYSVWAGTRPGVGRSAAP